MGRQRSDWDVLERTIGYCFLDRRYLERAFTHSTAAEGKPVEDNRRLAFLGDAVVELAVRVAVHDRLPLSAHGDLSKEADNVVPNSELAKRAYELGLDDWLDMGNGERKKGNRDSRMSDAFEALAGAIYLDAGSHAFPVLKKLLKRQVDAGN